MPSAPDFPDLDIPLVAILRGITPDEVEPVVSGLLELGLRAIEIPLNSPDPFTSISIAARIAPKDALIGAGTVTRPDDVRRLGDAGGTFLVSPNVDEAVLAVAHDLQMVTMPGVFTPTEALKAIACGASALKFFPASLLGPKGIAAIKVILPPETRVGAVGGVGEADFDDYLKAGVSVFGLGTNLFQPGLTPRQVIDRAERLIAAHAMAKDKIHG